MKHFIKNIIYFTIPIFFIIGPCLYILYNSGEIYSEGNMIKPLNKQQLIGLAYTEINEPYKFEMCDKVFHSDVIALGSSRIMQVKKNIISSKYSFYNAGGAVNNIYQYKLFLNRISSHPKLFIISIDQWFFNPYFVNQKISFKKECYKTPKKHLIGQCISLTKDIILGKIDFSKLFDRNNTSIGINAKINQNGFTSDGSYHYGKLINSPSKAQDYNFVNTYDRINHGDRRFQYCDKADTTVIETINSFLHDCHQEGISVIAILPPFAPLVNEKMEKSGKYEYMSQIYGILCPIFDKYDNCFLYDFSDMRTLAVHNYDFIDGFHGSELIYNIIIKNIINEDKSLSEYFVDSITFDSINNYYISKNIRFHKYD